MKTRKILICLICDRKFMTSKQNIKFCNCCKHKYPYHKIFRLLAKKYNINISEVSKLKPIIIAEKRFSGNKEILKQAKNIGGVDYGRGIIT